jgi:hypothetical protein
MADNVKFQDDNPATPHRDTIVASDEIGGVEFQRMKIVTGAEGVNGGDITPDNTLPGTLYGSDGKEYKKDLITGAFTTVDYAHHEIHAGDAYEMYEVFDQSINNVVDIQITTPATAKLAHFVIDFETQSETLWFIYENVDIILAGTPFIPPNCNRTSVNVSGLVIANSLNTSLANANLDTDPAAATVLRSGISGSGRDSGAKTSRNEIILAPSEDYCIRFIASTAGYVNTRFTYYEHTSIV